MKTVNPSPSDDDQSQQTLIEAAYQEMAADLRQKTLNLWLLKRAEQGLTPQEQQSLTIFSKAQANPAK